MRFCIHGGNIVGCLVYVGKGKHPPQWISELIARVTGGSRADVLRRGLYLFGSDTTPLEPAAFPPMMRSIWNPGDENASQDLRHHAHGRCA